MNTDNKIANRCKQISIGLKLYRDVIRFAIVLVVVHLFWKYSISYPKDNLASYDLKWFGIDIATPFIWLTNLVAEQVHWIITHLGKEISLSEGSLLRWPNGVPTRVVWGCCGLKQMFIFTCIILAARGKWVHKLWFIPVGILICHIYNILRITFLTILIEHHIEWFGFFHNYITKYLFYGIIFLLWVWWNECFNKSTRQ